MNEKCDIVAERVALGEPLGDAADHAASCSRCRRLAALPAELGKTHSEADPGLGFSARMTAGAQHRVTVRRRRRLAAGLATAVAATTLGVFMFTREPAQTPVAVTPPSPTKDQPAAQDHQKHDQPDPWKDPSESPSADDDVRALVHLANVEHSAHLSARWSRIEKSLRPYRALVKGTEP